MKKAHEQDLREIREYVLSQSARGEVVKSVEKVAEHMLGERRYEIYNVETQRDRWWVITNMTNLYSQRDYPSMDVAFSLHLGLMDRLMEREQPWGSKEEQDRLAGSWRRWSQASEAFDAADEAEDFQAIGVRCREALVSFVHDVADASVVPAGEEAPKASDVIHWSELIANAIAPGASNERVRGYLKAQARATWELVSWLTHAKNGVRMDATLAIEATGHTLFMFGMALIRKERGIPDRCPQCGSYRVTRDWRPEYGPTHENVTRCEACEWEDLPDSAMPDWDLAPEIVKEAAGLTRRKAAKGERPRARPTTELDVPRIATTDAAGSAD